MRRAPQLGSLMDPGWLFVIAGLAMCAAVILVPAEHRLDVLCQQLGRLEQEETLLNARLRAHANFIDELDRADGPLIRRLAAAQFNVVPSGEQPLLVARSSSASVTERIDGAVEHPAPSAAGGAISLLGRLTEGPYRLWLLGGSILSIFIGLLIGPGGSAQHRSEPAEPEKCEMRLDAADRVAMQTAVADLAMEEAESGPVVSRSAEAVQTIVEPVIEDVLPDVIGEEQQPLLARIAVEAEPVHIPMALTGELVVDEHVEDEADLIDEDEVGIIDDGSFEVEDEVDALATADGAVEETTEIESGSDDLAERGRPAAEEPAVNAAESVFEAGGGEASAEPPEEEAILAESSASEADDIEALAEAAAEGREESEKVSIAEAAREVEEDDAQEIADQGGADDADEAEDEDGEYEYEYVYEEVDEDDPAIVDGGWEDEFECVDADDSAAEAVDDDPDDDGEYEYEYVYEYVEVDDEDDDEEEDEP